MATEKKTIRVTKKQLDVARKARVQSDARAKEPKELDYDNYISSLSKMLSFYGLEFDNKSKKEWAVKYFKESDKELSKTLSKVSHQYFNTIGSLIRMQENGVVLKDESIHDRILQIANELKDKVDVEDLNQPTQAPTPRIEREDYFLGEFEGYCDDYLGKKKSLGIGSWVKQFSPTLLQVGELKTLIQKKIQEYSKIIEDKELQSAYMLTRKAAREVVDALTEAVNELSVTFQRKPRAPKVKSIDQMVSKVRYLKHDPELGLTSLEPATMLGKNALVTYDVKKRKIQYYVAEDGKEFGVDGTALTNVDLTKSIQKTLRNPKDQLLNMLQLGKRGFEKALNMVRSVSTEPSCKLTHETLICKIL